MNTEMLAFGAPGILELIIPAIIFVLCGVVPVVVVIYVIRLLIRNKQENQRLRLEVGKLADELGKVAEEVHLMREELKTASPPAKT